jgi:hypothetical protein
MNRGPRRMMKRAEFSTVVFEISHNAEHPLS